MPIERDVAAAPGNDMPHVLDCIGNFFLRPVCTPIANHNTLDPCRRHTHEALVLLSMLARQVHLARLWLGHNEIDEAIGIIAG